MSKSVYSRRVKNFFIVISYSPKDRARAEPGESVAPNLYCNCVLLRIVYSKAASKTNLTFFGLLLLVTAKWGRYQVLRPDLEASSSDSLRVYPFAM